MVSPRIKNAIVGAAAGGLLFGRNGALVGASLGGIGNLGFFKGGRKRSYKYSLGRSRTSRRSRSLRRSSSRTYRKKTLKGGSKKSHWIQNAISKSKHTGQFTRKALKHKMTAEKFASHVLSHKNEFDLTTRRQAQFLVNIRK